MAALAVVQEGREQRVLPHLLHGLGEVALLARRGTHVSGQEKEKKKKKKIVY